MALSQQLGSATLPRTSATAHPPRRVNRTKLAPYLMLAPGIVLFVLFLALPIGYSFVLSFQKTEINGLGLGPDASSTVFAGFSNYVAALTDPELLGSTLRILGFALVLIPTLLVFALLFALLLDSKRVRGGQFFRLTIFLPFAVPAVVSSLLWGFLYTPSVSPIYYLLRQAGITAPSLLDPQFVTFAIANVVFWGGLGFNMLIMYTALKAIPSDIYEAARIDGANERQMALRIKIPIIIPALVMTALFTVIGTFQVYAEPTTLMPLGNGISPSWSPLMLVYRDAFTRGQTNVAAATSLIIAAVTCVLSLTALKLVQRRAFAQEES